MKSKKQNADFVRLHFPLAESRSEPEYWFVRLYPDCGYSNRFYGPTEGAVWRAAAFYVRHKLGKRGATDG